ncbi:Permease of the drug/metabolite transporter (DMT) superfamily [hydrothermal vent metagenome]|uniref:Permease of the drug/metabolite transporter (DMT) superfamily n=1 Tax=hydrothermal vent metagenome TaxID=652676 RepID=A0A3B0RSG5_9ZZZZ
MSARFGLIVALVAMGVGWGLSMPLTKIAVSTGYKPFGLIFWQLVIVAAVLAVINRMRGKTLSFGRAQLGIYLMIALLGTILPNSASYSVAAHLPAGVLAIIMSTVPMIAFPIALMLGIERFSWMRIGGLLFGLLGIVLLIGPEASLPERAMVAFIPLALFAPLCYGVEGNLVAHWGLRGMDAVQALLGASLVGLVFAFPLALISGQWINPVMPWGLPEWALIGSSAIHGLVYTGYVWLVGRAGPVFAVQVSYLVTGFGVIWSILLLGESYSAYIWAALAMMFAGIFLVQPRARE